METPVGLFAIGGEFLTQFHLREFFQVTTRRAGCSDLSNGLTELLGQLSLRLLWRNQRYSIIITAIGIIINFTITANINICLYGVSKKSEGQVSRSGGPEAL